MTLSVGYGLPPMSTPLLPQTFWFRLAIPCRRIDGLPRSKWRLLDLPDECRLPDTAALAGATSWADVRAAWSPAGLALAVEVTGKLGPITRDPLGTAPGEGLQLWIDTRDTRTIHRATRFCHRFSFVLKPSPKGLSVVVAQKPIARAQADAPQSGVDAILTRADLIRTGWRLEVFLPAESLHGFDPETNRRLGIAYQVTDLEREDRFLTVGRDFPIGEDPSLWATLELVDH
jgi:hypothetical protein